MKKSENKESAQLTKEERKFIELYRNLSEDEKMKVSKMIEDKGQSGHTC
ncbi:MAG: hypothetical protein IIX16_08600 [Clostridia bacterium]|nr:hypothetical protein [Clostridia bacterium]